MMTYYTRNEPPTLSADKLKQVPTPALMSGVYSAYEDAWDGFVRDGGEFYYERQRYYADLSDILAELLSRPRMDLTRIHTRLLLKYLQKSRGLPYIVEPDDGDHGTTYDDIKAELAKREHIPNKIEGKRSRRTAAMMHRKSKLRL